MASLSTRTSNCDGAGSDQQRAFRRVSMVRTRKCSDERLEELRPLPLKEDASGGAQAPSASVFVCAGAKVGKPLLGFGGSFTESAAWSLGRLGAEKREEAMKAYFDPKHGLGYTIGRVPIASCDFSLENWTCGDLPEGDHELKGFSLERYETSGMLSMMHRAAELAGKPLALLASPWSPPLWMKTKRQFNGDGRLLPSCRDAWALHFVRFVEGMRRLDVPIWGVSVQNEAEAAVPWESCLYTAEEEKIFIRDHLGPALERASLQDVKVLFWDHNRDGMLERAALTYADPEAAKYIWGMCIHWYGDPRYESWPPRAEVPYQDRQKDGKPIFELRGCAGFGNVRHVADLRPDKHLLFSEGCQELGDRPLSQVMGDWKLGERYAMNIINDLNGGCEGFIDWNLFLDETGGPNHVGNLCVAPVICDSRTGTAIYQPNFWYIGHFSRYIRPGARRVLSSTSRDALEVTSFLNPDGSLAVVVMNQSEEDINFWFKVAGGGVGPAAATAVEAPARSILTLVVDDGEVELPLWQRIAEAVLPSALWRKSKEPWQKVQ